MTAGRRRAEPARGGLAPGRRWAGLRLALATAVGFLAATSTLAASAQAGVAQQFRDLKSTRLTASSSTMRPGWVTDAQLANTAALPGVRAACLRVSADGPVPVRSSLAARPDYAASVHAVGPGCVEATGMTVSQGRGLTGHDRETDARVALLGASVAAAVGLTALTGDDRVYLGDVAYTVVGILSSGPKAASDGALLVYLPTTGAGTGAVRGWEGAGGVVVDTEPAATDSVAEVLALSLQPADPGDVEVRVGGIPTGLESAVSGQLALLLAALGALSVVIGLFVIGNQALQSVSLRRSELALRRALGQPRHVVLVQVLAETVICGAAGGFLGALAGQLAAGAIAIGQGWPPVAQAGLVPLSALAGAVVGAVAGAYPAHVASTTDPSETLKTG